MPYYGSGIMERNVNTLRGLAQDKETSEVNALKKKETTLKINAVIRKQVMESRWIAGQYLNSVVDDPSYQKVKEAAKKNGTDISEWPTTFEKDFIERELAENNIRYQALGKGELLKVPMYRMNKDGTKETQEVVDNSPQFFRMLKGESGEPWKQGKLIAKPEPKLYETTEGYQTATNAIGKSKPTDMDAGEGNEYTLTPGSKRFKDGKVIASVPRTPKQTIPLTEEKIREKIKNVGVAREKFAATGGINDQLMALLSTTQQGREAANKIKAKPNNAEKYFNEYETYLKSLLPKKVYKELDDDTMRAIFEEAGNDPKKATKIAEERGYKVAPYSGSLEIK